MNCKQAFIVLFLQLMFCSLSVSGQATTPPSLANVTIPPSPEAATLAQFVESPVSWYTGIPQVGVPMWNLEGRDLSVSVGLSYHAGGIKVDQTASREGLGWSLNAGGAITRAAHGKPDEKPQGWLQIASQLPSPQTSNYTAAEQQLLFDLAQGTKDGQPDDFYVNMPGWSGKIVFDTAGIPRPIPYAKLKIEVDWGNDLWSITTADGVQYTFGDDAIEGTLTTSDCGDSYGQPITTAWYIKSIVAPDGDQIDFEYAAAGTVYEPLPRTETLYIAPQPVGGCNSKASDICDGMATTTMVRPTAIRSSRGSVEFEYAAAARTDLPGDHALEKVLFKRKSGALLKSFVLEHSYWSGRLMLDRVVEKGATGTQNPPYEFTYFKTHSLPAKGSYNQDHWGYANGQSNTSPVPLTEFSTCQVLGTADRSPSFLFSRAGSLEKITRPAGSITTFAYEAHTYDPTPDTTANISATANATAFCTGANCGSPGCGTCVPLATTTVVLDHDQCVEIVVMMPKNDFQCETSVVVKRPNNTIVADNWGCESYTQTSSIYLSAGTYILEARALLEDDNASITMNYSTLTSNHLTVAGGIRVASITDHDGYDSANDLVRNFSYTHDGDPNQPSGQIVSIPQYDFPFYEKRLIHGPGNGQQSVNCHFFAVTGSTRSGLGSTQGSHIGYGEVTEYIGQAGKNGRVVRKYTTAQQYPNGANAFPYGPVSDRDYQRGRMTYLCMYDSTGNKVRENFMAYTDRSENLASVTGFNVGYSSRSIEHPTDWSYSQLKISSYVRTSQWSYLSQSTSRQYDENGVNYSEVTTIHDYENPDHIQLTKSRMADSEGREVIQRFRYPQDYAVGNGDAHADALTKLKTDKFIHSSPIERTTWQKKPGGSEELLSGVLTLYREFSPGQILPEKLLLFENDSPVSNYAPSLVNSTFQYDSRYVERERVEGYNAYGNILQVLQKDGIRASYKWGYNQTLPVAKVLNGSSSLSASSALDTETAYIGFESNEETNNNPDEDYWQFNAANASIGMARSGFYCREIGAGSQVFGPTRELRPQDQNTQYVFSGWVKTPANYSNGSFVIHSKADSPGTTVYPASSQYASFQTVAIPATNGAWQYLEVTLDLKDIRTQAGLASSTDLRIRAYVMNQDGANTLKIDDLRIQPKNARLESMTYDPMIGQTSQANANDIVGSFNYDEFQRLVEARDQDGNLIRHLEYLYAGQNSATRNQITDEMAQVPVQTTSQLAQLSIGDKYKNRQYLDGWGRPLQSLQVGASPNGADLVSVSDYDEFGRSPKQWLPFAENSNQGSFVSNALTKQSDFYVQSSTVANDVAPFAETIFDNSPLNRGKEQSNPGTAFQIGSGHTQQIDYLVNTVAHPVRKWVISGGNCVSTAVYPLGELTATRSRDEDEGETYEFTDKLGRVIYKKVKLIETDNKTQGGLGFSWMETYWVFDDFGQIAYVIPPKATAQMKGTNNYDVNALTTDLVFQYKYDARHRIVEKKIPGKGWEHFVYDNLDRPVLSQDAVLRQQNRWQFIKFDQLTRPTMTGIFNETSHTSRTAMQNHVDGLLFAQTHQNYEERITSTSNLPWGYTGQSYPSSSDANGYFEPMSIFYYDDYDFDGDGTDDIAYMADPDNEYADQSFLRLRDQATRTQVRVLNRANISATVDWLTANSFYDKYGREVYSNSINHLGETELAYIETDFAGKILRYKRIHKHNLPTEIKLRSRFTFDNAGRLEATFQQNNSDDEIMLSQKAYNPIGQLIENNLHSTDNGQSFIQSIDYRYHIRGWMQQINDCGLRNEYASGQRIWALDDIRAEFQIDTNQYGYRTLFLELEMDQHSDQAGEFEYIEQTLTRQEALVLEESDSTAFAEALGLAGQSLTLEMQGASLHPAEFDNSVDDAVDALVNAMDLTGLKPGATTTEAGLILRRALEIQVSGTYANDDNNDLFGMRLHYEDGMPNLQGDARYSGNISGICWKSKSDNIQRGYGFRHDQIGRLREAHYAAKPVNGTKWTIENGHYDVPEIRYDFNGNITKVKRAGWFNSGAFGLMDNLTYVYSGNQLSAVTDQITAMGPDDFRDNGATSSLDYTYDLNGNMITDANKGLTVEYNHLNLPERMSFGGGDEILLLYDAAGNKLAKRVKQGGSPQATRQYLYGFVYIGSQLEFFATPEGRVVPDGSGPEDFRYEYHYRDHLGNTRLCFSDLDGDGDAEETEIMQELHYYPYGMTLSGLGTPQIGSAHLYGYNGKEIQAEFGLGWNDHGARMYDPSLARWMVIDPLAEKFAEWSPYNFVLANPTLLADPDGRAPGGDKRDHRPEQKPGGTPEFLTEASVLKNKNDTGPAPETDEALLMKKEEDEVIPVFVGVIPVNVVPNNLGNIPAPIPNNIFNIPGNILGQPQNFAGNFQNDRSQLVVGTVPQANAQIAQYVGWIQNNPGTTISVTVSTTLPPGNILDCFGCPYEGIPVDQPWGIQPEGLLSGRRRTIMQMILNIWPGAGAAQNRINFQYLTNDIIPTTTIVIQ